jgi:hypothetical protein
MEFLMHLFQMDLKPIRVESSELMHEMLAAIASLPTHIVRDRIEPSKKFVKKND